MKSVTFFRIEDCEESIISLKHIQIYIFMTVSLINFVLHLSQEAISLISFNIRFFSALLQVHKQKYSNIWKSEFCFVRPTGFSYILAGLDVYKQWLVPCSVLFIINIIRKEATLFTLNLLKIWWLYLV